MKSKLVKNLADLSWSKEEYVTAMNIRDLYLRLFDIQMSRSVFASRDIELHYCTRRKKTTAMVVIHLRDGNYTSGVVLHCPPCLRPPCKGSQGLTKKPIMPLYIEVNGVRLLIISTTLAKNRRLYSLSHPQMLFRTGFLEISDSWKMAWPWKEALCTHPNWSRSSPETGQSPSSTRRSWSSPSRLILAEGNSTVQLFYPPSFYLWNPLPSARKGMQDGRSRGCRRLTCATAFSGRLRSQNAAAENVGRRDDGAISLLAAIVGCISKLI